MRLFRRLILPALLTLAMPGAAKESPMPWKTEKNELFRCEVPAGWRAKPLLDGKKGWFYSDGQSSLRVERKGDAAGLIAGLKADAPEAAVSSAAVLGQTASIFRRQFQAGGSGDDVRAPAQWIYEETVVVPAKAGSWEIRFSAGSRLRQAKASDGETLKHFLKTFKPL